MSTPTPRTNAAWEASFSPEKPSFSVLDVARTLERELAAEREKAERYRLTTLKLDADLAAERARFQHLEKIARLEAGNCDRSTTSYYVIHIPTGRDYYKGGSDLPLAKAIDAAMKKGAK